MKNDPLTKDGIWKTYDIVMFYSRFEYETIANGNRKIVYPRFNMVLRSKKHHDIVVKISTVYNNENVYYTYNEKTKVKNMFLNTANYTILIFDQIGKQWNEFGIYNFPSISINAFCEFYDKKQNEIRKKLHQHRTHPRVMKALKDVTDEYIINELTKELLPSIEKIFGY